MHKRTKLTIKLENAQWALRRKLFTVDSNAFKYKIPIAYTAYLNHFEPEIPKEYADKTRREITLYLADQGEFDGYYGPRQRSGSFSRDWQAFRQMVK